MYLILLLAIAHGHISGCTQVVLKDLVQGTQSTMCYKDWLNIYEKYTTQECNDEHGIVVYRSLKDKRDFAIPFIGGRPILCKGA